MVRRKSRSLSEPTVQRLSLYLRSCEELETGSQRQISSRGLAEMLNLQPTQVRKDLSLLGDCPGIPGIGYHVESLRERLTSELGLDVEREVVIAGAGNLGVALANYEGFTRRGFRIVALLDHSPEKVGTLTSSGVPIIPRSELPVLASAHQLAIGVITVPADAAQEILDAFIDVEIRSILNFAPVVLEAPPGVNVKSVDLRASLETLTWFLGNPGARPEESGQAESRQTESSVTSSPSE